VSWANESLSRPPARLSRLRVWPSSVRSRAVLTLGHDRLRPAASGYQVRSGAGNGRDAVFLQEKISTAHFYAQQLLPQASGLLPAVTAGAEPLFAVDLTEAALG
jgi:Acetyl-CoA dehydrogenase C-terminal like